MLFKNINFYCKTYFYDYICFYCLILNTIIMFNAFIVLLMLSVFVLGLFVSRLTNKLAKERMKRANLLNKLREERAQNRLMSARIEELKKNDGEEPSYYGH